MKNIKKITAMLMTSVMTAGTVSSMTAGALANFNTKTDMDNVIENSFKLPDDSFMVIHDETYLAETEDDNIFRFYTLTGTKPDSVNAYISADADADAIESAIREICPDAEDIYVTAPYGVSNYRNVCVSGLKTGDKTKLSYEEIRSKDITYEQAIKVYELLKDTGMLENFEYRQASINSIQTTWHLTSYANGSFGEDYQELIENYIAENDLDWYISKDRCSYSTFYVTTGQRLSAEENYKIAEQIYNDLGITPLIIYPESASLSEDIIIEMHDKIDGDANNDGELTLADAIVTLQSVGNPEKYGINGWDETHITYQGSFNADIAGDYDGITTLDALAIQRKVLGLE